MNPIFVLQQRNSALVFDKNFKKIGALRKIEDSEDVAETVETKLKIKIIEPDKEGKVHKIAPRHYPYYDSSVTASYIVYSIYSDRKTKMPLFKIKRNKYHFSSAEIKYQVEITTTEPNSNNIFTIADFYIEPTTYKLLFPKKYW